jgi:hypothetical protein
MYKILAHFLCLFVCLVIVDDRSVHFYHIFLNWELKQKKTV